MSTSSSIGSPSVPHHFMIQSQPHPQQSRSDSPDILPNHMKSPLISDPYNAQSIPNNGHHSLYNSIHMPSDLTPTPSDHDDFKQHGKVNGFPSGPYRTSTAFNAFSGSRSRNPSIPAGSSGPFRDPQLTQSYPTAADIFQPPLQQHMSPTQTSLPPPTHGYDALQHQSRTLDFRGPQISNGFSSAQHKSSFNNVDPFGANSALLQSHQVGKTGILGSTQSSQQPPHSQSSQHQNTYHTGSQMSYVNGLPMQSQTPFGPHLPANGMSATTAPVASGPSMNHVNGGAQGTSQEEISTIFVVGFPDDMSEREFQNMFTFCSGFEAATLKIPNKESTAYGSGNLMSRGGGIQYQTSFAGQNDPYNLVTVNQGGVVVDGGRDGTTASWPATIPDDGHYVHNAPTQPPRKQIIGFAKFRSRQEALEARDVLQGRRVDIEKGAILKAEMAKKNLHTKRGVGPLGVPLSGIVGSGGNGVVASEGLTSYSNGINVGNGATGSEPLSARERELGTLGAMGFTGLRRDSRVPAGDSREDEDKERRRDREMGLMNAMGLGALGTRGPRERAEEDERERERRRRDKETRLRSNNTSAFDAFHSVPAARIGSTTEAGVIMNGFGLHSQTSMPNLLTHDAFGSNGSSPWGNAGAFRKQSVPLLTNLTARPSSPSQQSSPPNRESVYPTSAPMSASSGLSDNELPNNLSGSVPFSPPMSLSSLPSHPSLPSRPRPYSPAESQGQQHGFALNADQAFGSSSLPASSASSVSGSQGSAEGELSRSMTGLAVSLSQGSTSPQLPSPASGASSGTRGNPGDQNPPINTLYVGNLPTSPMPTGFPPNYLEDSLRELFSRRPGYRKLCFRQKSNGPMCFVEFEDVQYATKALNDLYGHGLNGLVKGGGIRLSYSKNPLGVRTPTSAANQQQQNSFSSHTPSAFAESFQPRQPVPIMPTYQDLESSRTTRRDTSGATSPVYHYTVSPPRYFSPSPSSQFSPQANPTAFARGNAQGFATSSTFSPFAMSPSPHPISDQSSTESNEHFHHALSATPNNLEAARAG